MGADTFFVRCRGESAKKAFIKAVSDARYEHGHGGYTGTIAEKSDFNMIPFNGTADEAWQKAEKMILDRHHLVDDKWGPAGCIEIEKGEYLFFGWASC